MDAMATKTKNRAGRPSAVKLLAQAHRKLKQGNYKQAVKDAKVCYRKFATDEHRRFLEITFIARAQQLQRRGDRDVCRGVVKSLLELGVTEPAVQTELPDLLLWLGMLEQLPVEQVSILVKDRTVWDNKVADQAVLHPDYATNSRPEICQAAKRIRLALESLSEGDQTAVNIHLKDIPRDSPLAVWKFFVRGLAAYYEQDFDRMRSNWSRMGSDRAAAKIAGHLLVIADEQPRHLTEPEVRAAITKVEQAIGAPTLCNQLSVLGRQLEEGQLSRVFKALRGVCRGLREIEPQLEQRLIRFFYNRMLNEGRVADLEGLAQHVDPLALDPRWNRAKALVREHCEEAHPEESLPFWRNYITDLGSLSQLPPAQRDLAQALVWLRLARSHAVKADDWRNCRCGASHEEETEESIAQSKKCLENCFQLAPGYVPAYLAMAALYEAEERPDEVAAAFRRLLQHNPDNVVALLHLAKYCLGQDEPIEAQRYAKQVHRMKPLDQEVTSLVWATHMAAARWYATRDNFDRGREEFQAADKFLPARRADYGTLASRAVLETKAGAVNAARAFIEQAQETLDEPTPLWQLMTILAVRYELPRDEQWYCEKRWTDALKRRCRSSTASAMCQLVQAYSHIGGSYRLPKEHVALVVLYLKRCTRVKWRADELRDVCELLVELEQDSLLGKYIRKGLKTFPDAAFPHVLAGEVEIDRGPLRCNHDKAHASIKTGLELAKGSSDPRDKELLERAQRSLTLLEEVRDLPSGGFLDDFHEDDAGTDDAGTDDAGPDIFDALSAGALKEMIESMCRESGLDPQKMLENMTQAGGAGQPSGQRSRRTNSKQGRGKTQ